MAAKYILWHFWIDHFLKNFKVKDDYGLAHIELRHGDQLRNNGFVSAYKFVEVVTTSFDSIKEGQGDTFLLEAHNEHNDTLFIKLVKDMGYRSLNRMSSPNEGFGAL